MTTIKDNKVGNVYSYMRWSTPRQEWGDSEKRQAKLAQEWCQRHGRTLSDRTFADRGVSAWKGRHREEGELGSLLKIASEGDTVLVESTDRWSREETIDAMVAIRDTVKRGVRIEFLSPPLSVSRETLNDESVLFSLFIGSMRANKENTRKASLIRASVITRRETMEKGIPVPGRMPAWIDWRWDDERKKSGRPVVNEEKAKAVRRIFDLCLKGHGLAQIELLMRETPPITARGSYGQQKAKWNSFFIHRTMTDKSVLGFQRSSGLKIYPTIVSEEVFYAAAAKMKARSHLKSKSRGLNDNLFSGLCKCSACGETYVRQRAIARGKRYDYLVCSGALRHLTACKKLGYIRYDKLEASLLSLLSNAGFVHRLLDTTHDTPSALDTMKGELVDVQKQCEKYLRLIEDDPNPSPRLNELLKGWEAKERELAARIEAEEIKARVETPAIEAYDKFADEFAAKLKKSEFRRQAREVLRDIIDRIVVEYDSPPSRYQVYLKGAKMPVDVILGPGPGNDWLFSPSPKWVMKGGAQ